MTRPGVRRSGGRRRAPIREQSPWSCVPPFNRSISRCVELARSGARRLASRSCVVAASALVIADVTCPSVLRAADAVPAASLGARLPLVSIAPFMALLGAIAILPLFAGHWWERNRNKALVSGLLALPIMFYLGARFGTEGIQKLEHSSIEYVSFLTLLGSLFVITGGIYVQGSLSGTPLVNMIFMGLGALLASVVGTTGASMLLIRPLLRANQARVRKAHVVVFFIFVVSNCGGLLTPLGDPPLFLGFLKGVPFEWTLRLWKPWMVVNFVVLAIFNVWDQIIFAREEKERPGSQLEQVQQHQPLRIVGWHNLLFLAGVVGVVVAAGQGLGNGGHEWPFGVQQGLLAALAITAYLTTSPAIRVGNRFSFTPINEVAILFAGIFMTMIPALEILNANGRSLGVDEPWEFFWVTGALSSVLDNAPTYLTFAATACGIHGVPLEGRYLADFLSLPDTDLVNHLLAAISCGAVFMGANTYIGNGPNLMVKAIAEESGLKMPGFFGYMGYAAVVLLPVFCLVTFLFFL
jgi:Na+/H+ antiporter NhaD/arsenite permease-like protein